MLLRLMTMMITLAVVLCFAGDPTVGAKADTAGDNNPNVKPGMIARDFNVPLDSVNALRDSYKIGWGGISKAYAMAQRLEGYTVRDILDLKTEQKMGWGQIAAQFGLKPGEDYKPLNQTTTNTMDKMDLRTEKQEQRMDKKQERMEAHEMKMDAKNK